MNARLFPIILLVAVTLSPAHAAHPRWSEQAAQDWYGKQPWLVGSNYIPANAINQLEMWQADTFDPTRIELEQQDSRAFIRGIDTFLIIPQRHHIRPLLVLFDSV
jgi:hypothetical protein